MINEEENRTTETGIQPNHYNDINTPIKCEDNTIVNEICDNTAVISDNHNNVECQVNLTNETVEEKYLNILRENEELKTKLELANQLQVKSKVDKEAMVIKFASSEKFALENKQQTQNLEKKCSNLVRESKILEHKVQSLKSEKIRICQMLDDKTHEFKNSQQQLESAKAELNMHETKLKTAQSNLKTEANLNKQAKIQIDTLNVRLQESNDQIIKAKSDAERTIKEFYTSQENRAYILDQQVKEQLATLITLRHENDELAKKLKMTQIELDKLCEKDTTSIAEINKMSSEIDQLRKDKRESTQKLEHLQTVAEEQNNTATQLETCLQDLEKIQFELAKNQDSLKQCTEDKTNIINKCEEMESSMGAYRNREAELLFFTQQLTERNAKIQSEFTDLKTKVEHLTYEEELLQRSLKDGKIKSDSVIETLNADLIQSKKENETLQSKIDDLIRERNKYQESIVDQKDENVVIIRKLKLNLKEVNKELLLYRKKLDQIESSYTTSSSSSNSSLSIERGESQMDDKVISSEVNLDKQTLINHIVKLHGINAKQMNKIEFLEEHVNSLLDELQNKTRPMMQNPVRSYSSFFTSTIDKEKVAKVKGIMASMYSPGIIDDTLTLELSLEINRKLQTVLEDVLLKNITLKENVETLGQEIARLLQSVAR